jgi:soluble lytic murein transglycosylase-like protein
MFAGVVFTITHVPVAFRQVHSVAKLPGTVIEAPPVSQETFRVASILKRYTSDTITADRIAGAIVDQGVRRNLDPALLVGVLLTEDETLDTMARSDVGARGLMQVMPFHSGKWGCGSSNLFSVESNICHGASVLEDAVRSAPNVRVALLRYNGCVHGSHTKNCHSYPDKVMRVAIAQRRRCWQWRTDLLSI